jgi:hypothetical protein
MLDRRDFLRGMGAATITPALQAANSKQPNFVVILADDMGFSDARCYGGDINTPNLDRLASNGLRFTQMYSTARCGRRGARCSRVLRSADCQRRDDAGQCPGYARFIRTT